MILRRQNPRHRKGPNRAFGVPPHRNCPRWQNQNLLSVRRIEPYFDALHLGFHQSERPAIRVVTDHSAQSLGNCLMPETRAKQRLLLRYQIADQRLQPRDPSLLIMDRRRASRDDPTVMNRPRCRELPVLDRIHRHPPIGAQLMQQRLELAAIPRMRLCKGAVICVGHQHRNMHDLPLYIFMNLFSIF